MRMALPESNPELDRDLVSDVGGQVVGEGGVEPADAMLTAPADRNPALVYLARLAPGSRRAMTTALSEVARLVTGVAVRDAVPPMAEARRTEAALFPWHRIDYQHAQAIRAKLAEGALAPATVNKYLAAVRGTVREAWRLGLMDTATYMRVTEVEGVRGSQLPAGRALSAGEIQALFAACADGTAGGQRDAAMLALLYGGLLRRSEAVSVKVADYNPETGEVRVRRGKGRKERLVHLPAGGKDAVTAWLAVRGTEPGRLLTRVSKAGVVSLAPISAQAAYGALDRRRRKARVAKFTPHDLRRSAISDLFDAGADTAAVKGLAGHARVETTIRYDRRGERAKKKAASMLHVPFVPARLKTLGEAAE